MMMLNFTRKEYHKAICTELISYQDGPGVTSSTDKTPTMSGELARRMISRLNCATGRRRLSPDTIRHHFTRLTKTFISQSLSALGRPIVGEWAVFTTGLHMAVDASGRQATVGDVQGVLTAYPRLRTELNRYCLITPDIIVARRVRHDDLKRLGWDFLREARKVQPTSASHKAVGYECPLYAVISCNWTIRGSPDEHASVEVLNLCRNGSGSTPHTMAVTFEPLPNRLASMAFATSDLDCLYHVALWELLEAIDEVGGSDHKEMVQALVQGRRLRDISDLPLDLAI